MSSFTTNKNLEKPNNGEYVDSWNVPLNADMNVIDAALGSVTNLNATAGNATLSSNVSSNVTYINMALNVTGAMTANVVYTIPNAVGGMWIVRNATTDSVGGPWTVTVASGGGGSNVTVLRGKASMIWSDGTNIRNVDENVPSIGTVTSVGVSGGSTGLTTSNSPVTTNGTITIGGVLNVASGGTNLTAFGTGVSGALAANVTGTGGMVLSTNATATMTNLTVSTNMIIPRGNTAQRPVGSNGALFYNTQLVRFEGYAGTSWDSLGAATGGGSDAVFYLNDNVVTTSYTIPTGQNAMSTGPLTINAGVTITVPAGSAWKVL